MMEFKNYQEFKNVIKNCNITATEAEYSKSVDTPFICYFRLGEDNIYSDGIPIVTKTQIIVELYTEKSDTNSEKQLEQWFFNNDISSKKRERVFITSEKFYQTVYEFELIFYE